MAAANKDVPRVAQNKKAYHDFFVLETYEAGIALFGTEVKSIRKGRVNLKDSWCNIVGGEIFANGMHISPYKQQGLTLIPLSVYFVNGRAKLEVGLCKGKKNYDKREAQAKKDAQRDIDRATRPKL